MRAVVLLSFHVHSIRGDAILLWEKRIQADDADGALIISHKVPSGVIQYATSSAKCREKNPATIELDDVAAIDKITKNLTRSTTIKLESNGLEETFDFKRMCNVDSYPRAADVTVSLITVPLPRFPGK